MAENDGNTSCPQTESAEREGHPEAPRTFRTLWKERGDAAPDLLERMPGNNNLNRAYKQEKANKGAPGSGGMLADKRCTVCGKTGMRSPVVFSRADRDPLQ